MTVRLALHPQALSDLKALFAQRNYPLTALNEQQAALPEKCEMVPNTMGTAPGMWFEQDGKVFVSMPGVPYEMKAMMTNTVLPRLQETFALPVIFHQMVQTVGIGESWLSEKIADWESALPEHIRLGLSAQLWQSPSSASPPPVITCWTWKKSVDGAGSDALEPLIEKYVFGYGDISLEEAIGRDLLSAGKTLALAESCTGGLVAHQHHQRSRKLSLLSGRADSLRQCAKNQSVGGERIHPAAARGGERGHGARNGRKRAAETVRSRTWDLATSGIAGPGGGTA